MSCVCVCVSTSAPVMIGLFILCNFFSICSPFFAERYALDTLDHISSVCVCSVMEVELRALCFNKHCAVSCDLLVMAPGTSILITNIIHGALLQMGASLKFQLCHQTVHTSQDDMKSSFSCSKQLIILSDFMTK